MIQIKTPILNGYTFIDLFSGIGGFRLGLESLGAQCVFSSEIDKFARETYISNFHDEPAGDITQIDASDIPDHDILCGGFPCQPFSIGGEKKGFDDARGTLFFDIARIVKAKQPKVVFMENVKNLISHDNGNTFRVISNTMKNLGYNIFYSVLNPVLFNVPQKRERTYIVCFREDLNINNFSFPVPNLKDLRHVEDILLTNEKELEDYYVSTDRPDYYITNHNDNTYSNKPIRVGHVGTGSQGQRIYSIKGTAITLTATGGGLFGKTGGYMMPDKRPRKLHPRECARLMGFPDSYILHSNKTQALKQLGNSVVVDIIQFIGIEISRKLKEQTE